VALFTDATILTETPPPRACRSSVGAQAEVPVTGNRDKKVVFGALNPATGTVWPDEAPKWNQYTFQEHPRNIRATRSFGGENPELTVCQVRTAMSAVVRSLWLSGRCGTRLLERTAKELEYTQARRAQARKSHTKATRRTLQAAGVRLTALIRCRWPVNRAL
jgi:hypothetical protein